MNKDKMVLQAILADKAERNEDMLSTMKSVVRVWKKLSSKERKLFYLAFSRAADARRNSYLLLSHEMENNKSNEMRQIAEEYRAKVEKEIREICDDVFDLLNNFLIPGVSDAESKVFYQRMKGDYYQYLLYFVTGDEMNSVKEESRKAYQEGFDISISSLPAAHHRRLDITAKLAIFYSRILNSHEKACQLAQQALDDATSELGSLDDDFSEICKCEIELLREILTWPKENENYEACDNSSD